uniref:Ribosome-binding factor A n=1 Tax=Syphacia muris TaxID=451379 RepID=A0A0N5AWU7_9BILA
MRIPVALIIGLTTLSIVSAANDNENQPKRKLLSQDEVKKLQELLKNETAEEKTKAIEEFIATLPEYKQEILRNKVSQKLSKLSSLMQQIKTKIHEALNEQQQKDFDAMITNFREERVKMHVRSKRIHEFLINELGEEEAAKLFGEIDELLKNHFTEKESQGFFSKIKDFFYKLFHYQAKAN